MGQRPEDTDISMTEYQALAEFRFRIRHFLHFSEQVARAAGIEPQQHQLMLAIKGFPNAEPATITDLAERLQLQHHSVVELVNRAEGRGLVKRSRGEADRRQVFIHLTDAGEQVLSELSLHHRGELRVAGPELVRALNALVPAARDERESSGQRG
ncbi:MAG TPA: MarR family transcriptional regulator [Thermomicrobiales bacterium]|nr:MarR family transcriptional regulator [Thermomicrobiales bacterium]